MLTLVPSHGMWPPLRGDLPLPKGSPLCPMSTNRAPGAQGPAWMPTLQRAGGSRPVPQVPGMDPPGLSAPAALTPTSSSHCRMGQPEGPGPARGQLGAGPDDGPSRRWESTLQFEAEEMGQTCCSEGRLLRLP